jgi:DNA-binding response OmpR family regulator
MISQSWDRDTAQEAVELPLSLRVFPIPRTVLVVDDERDTNDILANLVQARGLEPVQVFSGQQGLAAVAEAKPELILLDLMLPDLDGFEFCDRLKRARETNLIPIVMVMAIPIVMVLALQDAHHRATGVRVGANGCLTKPFTPAQLYEMIDTAFTWHEEHKERGTTGEIDFDVR